MTVTAKVTSVAIGQSSTFVHFDLRGEYNATVDMPNTAMVNHPHGEHEWYEVILYGTGADNVIATSRFPTSAGRNVSDVVASFAALYS